MRKIFSKYNSINLSLRIVVGSILGIIIGLVFQDRAAVFKPLGDVFLRLVQMGVPILIFTSIVESTASLPMDDLKTVGGKTLWWFAITTAIASIMSVIGVYLFPPVIQGVSAVAEGAPVVENTVGGLLDIFVNFIPTNALGALADGRIVQIVLFGSMFGISLNILRGTHPALDTVYDFTVGSRRVVMRIIGMIMGYAPIGIMGMLANIIGTQGSEIISTMGLVLLSVSVLNLIYFVGYTLFMIIRHRLSLTQLIKNATNILIVALTTTSSSISLPVSLEYVPKNMGVRERIANFVLPLGTAINTNGAPMTNIVCCVAAAGMYGIDVNPTFLIMLGVYAFIASFGNPGVPGGGIISLMVVMDMAGIPAEAIGLFAGLDYFFSLTRILDNVMGNVYSALHIGIKMDEFDREVFDAEIADKLAVKAALNN